MANATKMKRKFGFGFIAVLFAVLLAFSAAADSGKSGSSGDDIKIKAGITPDSRIHVFDRMLDRIGLALAFGSESRAEKAIAVAGERLAEAEEMIASNRLDAAGVAQAGHDSAFEVARQSIRSLRNDNSGSSLEAQIKLEAELEKHEMEISRVKDGLKLKLEMKDGISESQLLFIDSLMSLLQNQTGKVKADIESEKGKLKLKIKSEEGKSEAELEVEIRGFEERVGLVELRKARAAEQIDDALEEIADVKALMSGVNLSNLTGVAAVSALVSEADVKIAAARAAFDEGRFGEAFGLAESAEMLAKNAERQLERAISATRNIAVRNGFGGDERLEIKVEVFNATSEAKVELRFAEASTNRTEVIDTLLSRLNLSKEDISLLLDLENESEGVPELNDRLKTDIRIREGLASVRFELEFPVNSTNRSDIVDTIFSRLSSLTREDLEKALGAEERAEAVRDEDEREIEIEIEDGIAKVKVEVGRGKLRFSMPFTTESALFSEIASRTGIPLAEVASLSEIEIEGDDDEREGRRGRGSGDDDDDDESRGSDSGAREDGKRDDGRNKVRGRDAEADEDDGEDNRRGSGNDRGSGGDGRGRG